MKVLPRRRGRLLDFHRPEKLGIEYPLKPESILCLQNLSAYKRPPAPGRYPRSRSAAVLVALFVGRGGDLYALLSRRSDRLRSYPGDTSLPGGKLERIDRSMENAARREAFEEIGLPLDKTKVPLLCILEPFLAGNFTIVTPVVVLITDQTLRPILNSFEVQSIFSHPLFSFLTISPLRDPEPRSSLSHANENFHGEPLAATPSELLGIAPNRSLRSPFPPEAAPARTLLSNPSSTSTYALQSTERPYHTYTDMPWHGKDVRLHRFLTGREAEGVKPIFGMTASILIRTAEIGYAREPEFELYAPGQPSLPERIATAIREDEVLRKACWEEGIERDWGLEEAEPHPKNRSGRGGAKAKKPARL